MYKEFDLQKAKNGAKLAMEREYGCDNIIIEKARLIAVDLKGDNPVVVAVECEDGSESVYQCGLDGVGHYFGMNFYIMIKEEERIPFTIKDYKEGNTVLCNEKKVNIFTTKAVSKTPIVGQIEGINTIWSWSEEDAKQILVIVR